MTDLNNSDIVIKPADKGSSIVIMNSEYYRDKLVLADHLHSSSYEKVNADSDDNVVEELNELVRKHSTCLTEKETAYIKDEEWRTSEFYVLPKVHKSKSIIEAVEKTNADVVSELTDPPDLKGRPIVAGCSTPTRGLSVLISKILKPIVESQQSYVKDDWDVLGNYHVPLEEAISCLDVTSLHCILASLMPLVWKPYDIGFGNDAI